MTARWYNPVSMRLVATSDHRSFERMPWWPEMTTGVPVPFDTRLPNGRRSFNTTWAPWAHVTLTGAESGEHPGMFGAVRKHDVHTGVDIYVPDGTLVTPVENGVVVGQGFFTGPQSDPPTPWWHETGYVLVEGESGVVCYGELASSSLWHSVGDVIGVGDMIGRVGKVLKESKGRPACMLHLELYERGFRGEPVTWNRGEPQPAGLLDPTPFLLELCR